MKFIELSIRHKNSIEPKVVNLDNNVVLINSDGNTKGKTTIIRSILYTMGYNIPSTQEIKFKDYIFKLKMERKKKIIEITRKNDLLIINNEEYSLPADSLTSKMFLFNCTNENIVNNILGSIYFDQDYSWTMINRGRIIGDITFNVEDLFRGLKEETSDASLRLLEERKEIDRNIAKYNTLKSIGEYQTYVERNVIKKAEVINETEKKENELTIKNYELNKVDSEILMIKNVMHDNRKLIDYIEKRNIYIKISKDADPILLNKDNIFNYDENNEANEARLSLLYNKRSQLKKEIANLSNHINKESLFDISNIPEYANSRLSKIESINLADVERILDRLKKEREEINKKLLALTKDDNRWIIKANKLLDKYFSELGISEEYKKDIFTKDKKTKSGAILHEYVFIFKLVYIKLVSEKLGYNLPIICDSPNGREIEKIKIENMLNILKRDFDAHQIIIASIKKYNKIFDINMEIKANKTLFDAKNLLSK